MVEVYNSKIFSSGSLSEIKGLLSILKKPYYASCPKGLIRERISKAQFSELQYLVDNGVITLPSKPKFYAKLVAPLEQIEGSLDKLLTFLKNNGLLTEKLFDLIEPKLLDNAEAPVKLFPEFKNPAWQ